MSEVATLQETPWSRLLDRAISDPAFPITHVESLWRMKLENDTIQNRQAFNAAMAACQSEMQPIARDARNSHTNSKYATYETIDTALRPIYSAHGFSVMFGTGKPVHAGYICITCRVKHVGGYEEDLLELEAPPDAAGSAGKANKTPVQAIGSTVSYLRRYLLGMAFNLVLSNDDDDGEATRRTTRPADRPNGETSRPAAGRPATAPSDPLEADYGPGWIAALGGLLEAADSLDAVAAILGHPRARAALVPTASTPPAARAQIDAMIAAAKERLAKVIWESGTDGTKPDDELAEMLAEVEANDLDGLEALEANPLWRKRRFALFPPDQDTLHQAITDRRTLLRTTQGAVS